eukprot:4033813-Amphidinium_carterae.1
MMLKYDDDNDEDDDGNGDVVDDGRALLEKQHLKGLELSCVGSILQDTFLLLWSLKGPCLQLCTEPTYHPTAIHYRINSPNPQT